MKRLIGLTMAVTAALSTSAFAAAEHDRIRGTVASIAGSTLTVHTTSGEDVPVMLGSDTKYLMVEKSSLSDITKDSYIGTATKEVGSMLVALEVVVFPASMRGAGEGHYGWDKIPDTTLAGDTTTKSAMTNGSVAAVSSSQTPAVNSSMTNGSVASSSSEKGAKQLTVTYKGGQQKILVPPTAPIVTFKPGSMSELTKGATVFVNAMKDDGKVTANSVAVGTNGVKPPM